MINIGLIPFRTTKTFDTRSPPEADRQACPPLVGILAGTTLNFLISILYADIRQRRIVSIVTTL